MKRTTLKIIRVAMLGGLFLGMLSAVGAQKPPTTPQISSVGAAAPEPSLPAWGTITDSVTGKPVSDATVYVYTAGVRTGTSPFCPSCYADCGKRVTTNPHGTFRIPALATSLIFRLLVVRDGYDSTFVENVDVLKKQAVTVALKPRPAPTPTDLARTVLGRVLDENDQPVVGASVEVFGFSQGENRQFGGVGAAGIEELAITDRMGRFAVRCSQENTSLSVLVKARGLAPVTTSSLKTGALLADNTVHLPVGVTVRGLVKGITDGKPIADAVAHLVPVDRNAETFTGWQEIGTDDTGKFELSNVPADRDYVLCVRMDSLTGRGLVVNSQRIHVGKNGTILDGLTLTAQPSTTTEGHLVLTPATSVAPNTRVMVYRTGTWDVQFANVESNGTFHFAGLPGADPLELSVQVRGYHLPRDEYSRRRFSVPVPPRHTGPLIIPMEQDVAPVRFHLVTPTAVKPGEDIGLSWKVGDNPRIGWVNAQGDFSLDDIHPGEAIHLLLNNNHFHWKKPDADRQEIMTLTAPSATDRAEPLNLDIVSDETQP